MSLPLQFPDYGYAFQYDDKAAEDVFYDDIPLHPPGDEDNLEFDNDLIPAGLIKSPTAVTYGSLVDPAYGDCEVEETANNINNTSLTCNIVENVGTGVPVNKSNSHVEASSCDKINTDHNNVPDCDVINQGKENKQGIVKEEETIVDSSPSGAGESNNYNENLPNKLNSDNSKIDNGPCGEKLYTNDNNSSANSVMANGNKKLTDVRPISSTSVSVQPGKIKLLFKDGTAATVAKAKPRVDRNQLIVNKKQMPDIMTMLKKEVPDIMATKEKKDSTCQKLDDNANLLPEELREFGNKIEVVTTCNPNFHGTKLHDANSKRLQSRRKRSRSRSVSRRNKESERSQSRRSRSRSRYTGNTDKSHRSGRRSSSLRRNSSRSRSRERRNRSSSRSRTNKRSSRNRPDSKMEKNRSRSRSHSRVDRRRSRDQSASRRSRGRSRTTTEENSSNSRSDRKNNSRSRSRSRARRRKSRDTCRSRSKTEINRSKSKSEPKKDRQRSEDKSSIESVNDSNKLPDPRRESRSERRQPSQDITVFTTERKMSQANSDFKKDGSSSVPVPGNRSHCLVTTTALEEHTNTRLCESKERDCEADNNVTESVASLESPLKSLETLITPSKQSVKKESSNHSVTNEDPQRNSQEILISQSTGGDVVNLTDKDTLSHKMLKAETYLTEVGEDSSSAYQPNSPKFNHQEKKHSSGCTDSYRNIFDEFNRIEESLKNIHDNKNLARNISSLVSPSELGKGNLTLPKKKKVPTATLR